MKEVTSFAERHQLIINSFSGVDHPTCTLVFSDVNAVITNTYVLHSLMYLQQQDSQVEHLDASSSKIKTNFYSSGQNKVSIVE